jgi:fatty acid amide hydrolase 2
MTVKECIPVAGQPNAAGLKSRAAYRSPEDSPVVQRLKAAGLVIVGTTNMSELGMWMESRNTLYGTTGNPYDPSRTAGGSSGGEAAIVGSGAVPFGLGSDIGGSIRMPSFFCGVFGHKPSTESVPLTGHYPMASGTAARLLGIGPITRHAEDLAPLLRVIQGAEDSSLRLDLDRLRVLTIPKIGHVTPSPEVGRALESALSWLKEAGAESGVWTHPALKKTFQIWSARMHAGGGPSFASILGEGNAISPIRELAKWITRSSNHTFMAIGLALLEDVPKYLPDLTDRFLRLGRELSDAMRAVLDERTVFVIPVYPRVAPKHGRAALRPADWITAGLVNAMELPATAVPLGLGSSGLPVGVQVVAGPGRDTLAISVSERLAERFGGWRPPAIVSQFQSGNAHLRV